MVSLVAVSCSPTGCRFSGADWCLGQLASCAVHRLVHGSVSGCMVVVMLVGGVCNQIDSILILILGDIYCQFIGAWSTFKEKTHKNTDEMHNCLSKY